VGVSVDPLGDGLGPSELPDGFMVFGVLTEPVRLPTPAVLPVVPLDGEAVVTPLPKAAPPLVEPPPVEPPVCASANVPDSANAVAKAIVVNFMVHSSWLLPTKQLVAGALCSVIAAR